MPRKNVNFHPVMTEATREQLDRLARRQGVSRSEIIRRALNLLDVQVSRRPSPVVTLDVPPFDIPLTNYGR